MCQIRKLKGTSNSFLEDGVSYYLFEAIFDSVNVNTTTIVLRDTVKYLVSPEEGTKTEL